jgi:hypothetical protein
MRQKRHIGGLSLVTMALISANCLGQQVQATNLDSSSVQLDTIAASTNALSVAATPSPTSTVAMKAPSAVLIPKTLSSAPLLRTIEPLPLALTPDGSVATTLTPVLRGVLIPKRQPAKGLRSLLGQHPDVGVFAVGNFNPTYYVGLAHGAYQITGSNKSSLGAGIEFRRYWNRRNALGLLYVQNPSDGNLWVPSGDGKGTNSIWPQMRYEVSVLATQQLPIGRFSPFLSEGPGVVVTNGYGNCGWSGGFAFVAGLGTEYEFSPRLSARTGITFLETKSGCYDDPTCSQTWGVVEDMRVGFVYNWSGQRGGHPAN